MAFFHGLYALEIGVRVFGLFGHAADVSDPVARPASGYFARARQPMSRRQKPPGQSIRFTAA
ncbi:MAG: hypothetical protein BroJett013_23400 [Alphaproteobacteria bacterium]|nr:MAG: hypothetical protein BroJett013_23400 [Alphaproteobacteria bacterium]